MRAIAKPPGLHRPWAERARARLRESPDAARHWNLLRAFIVPGGYIADALIPTPEREETIEQAAERVRRQDRALWREDLELLRGYADRPATAAQLDVFEEDVAVGAERLVEAVEWVWRLTVEPHWHRIRGLEVGDIEHRLALLARGGVDEMLRTLHPDVRRETGGLWIDKKDCIRWAGSEGMGLTLIPSVFAWPGTLVLNRPPYVPTLVYAPRGIGALWLDDEPQDVPEPLSTLIGGTRAAVLRQLDLPMTTTQIARHLNIARASASDHLKVLTCSDLVSAHRRGREVFYRRTELGGSLAGCVDPGAVHARDERTA